jgi:hypothetical protein
MYDNPIVFSGYMKALAIARARATARVRNRIQSLCGDINNMEKYPLL